MSYMNILPYDRNIGMNDNSISIGMNTKEQVLKNKEGMKDANSGCLKRYVII